MVMLIFVLSCLGVQVALGTDPRNRAAGVGDAEVILQCAYGATAGRTWSKGSTKIATNDALEVGVEATKYAVATNGANYTLKVKTIDNTDGEKYACSVTSNTKYARLVTIAKPTCALANEGADKIKLTCIGGYGGDWPPLSTMKDNADAEIGSGPGGTQADGATTRVEDITISGNMDGHVLKCDMVLHESNRPDKADGHVAQNNPGTADDKYKCTVTAVKPAGITITSREGHSGLTEGDTLTCAVSTSGVPTATIKWLDPDNADIGTGASYTVTSSMVGKMITCSVGNNIGSSSATFPDTASEVSTIDETSDTIQVSTATLGQSLGTLPRFSIILQMIAAVLRLVFS